MGLFSFLKYQNQIAESILPAAAKSQLLSGNLPLIKTSSIFLKRGEQCVYIDKAILNDHVKKKIYRHAGGSSPGFFKGTRINYGTGHAKEYEETEQHKGILCITNQRVIFQSLRKGFDKQHRYLSSIEPYANAVVLQYGEKNYELIVPDGSIVNAAIRLVN